MDNLRLAVMGMLQPIAHLHKQFQLVDDRHGPPFVNDARDRLAIQALHHQVRISVLLSALVDGDDVPMLQACGRAQFAVEKLLQLLHLAGTSIRPLEHLDGDRPIQRSIMRAIDDAHPARADDVDHGILPDLPD